jgi:hypothetical protein
MDAMSCWAVASLFCLDLLKTFPMSEKQSTTFVFLGELLFSLFFKKFFFSPLAHSACLLPV